MPCTLAQQSQSHACSLSSRSNRLFPPSLRSTDPPDKISGAVKSDCSFPWCVGGRYSMGRSTSVLRASRIKAGTREKTLGRQGKARQA